MPRKKAPSKRSATKINKSEWIRSQPPTLSAKEVREKAAAEGISLSPAQIYAARSSAEKNSGPKGAPGRSKGPRNSAGKAANKGGDDELAFRRLVLSIGLPQAEAYLLELKRSVGL